MLRLVLISDFKDCVVWLIDLYEYCVKQYFVMFYNAMCRQVFLTVQMPWKAAFIVGIPTYARRAV